MYFHILLCMWLVVLGIIRPTWNLHPQNSRETCGRSPTPLHGCLLNILANLLMLLAILSLQLFFFLLYFCILTCSGGFFHRTFPLKSAQKMQSLNIPSGLSHNLPLIVFPYRDLFTRRLMPCLKSRKPTKTLSGPRQR